MSDDIESHKKLTKETNNNEVILKYRRQSKWNSCAICKIFILSIIALIIVLSILIAVLRHPKPIGRLKCFECESSYNFPERNTRLVNETDCWAHPKYWKYCEEEQYCGSLYQEVKNSEGTVVKQIQRACYKKEKPGCRSGTKHGILEVSCICDKDLCIAMEHN